MTREALRFVSEDIPVPVDSLAADDELVRDALPRQVHVTLVVQLTEEILPEPGHNAARPRGRLFNGLPILSAFTGLPFHVDAPFNLDVERMDILEDDFNKWLIHEVSATAGQMLCELRQNPSLCSQLYRLVPADAEYGRSRGAGEVTQRLLLPVHTALQELGRGIGVLPCLAEGEPLRPEQAVILTGGNASDKVAAALQHLLGGQDAAAFQHLGQSSKGDRVRLCAVPDRSHLQKLRLFVKSCG